MTESSLRAAAVRDHKEALEEWRTRFGLPYPDPWRFVPTPACNPIPKAAVPFSMDDGVLGYDGIWLRACEGDVALTRREWGEAVSAGKLPANVAVPRNLRIRKAFERVAVFFARLLLALFFLAFAAEAIRASSSNHGEPLIVFVWLALTMVTSVVVIRTLPSRDWRCRPWREFRRAE